MVQWFWQLLKTLSILLGYYSASLLLDIHPRELKTHPHKNLHTHVHSSVIHHSQKGKYPKCSSTEKLIKYGIFIQ